MLGDVFGEVLGEVQLVQREQPLDNRHILLAPLGCIQAAR